MRECFYHYTNELQQAIHSRAVDYEYGTQGNLFIFVNRGAQEYLEGKETGGKEGNSFVRSAFKE